MSPLTPEQQEELAQMFAANRVRQEALTRKQRFEAGEFSIELDRTEDDPAVNDPVFQDELSRFGGALRAAGISYSQIAIALDAVDAHGHPLPEFVLAIKVLGPPVIAALTAVTGLGYRLDMDGKRDSRSAISKQKRARSQKLRSC